MSQEGPSHVEAVRPPVIGQALPQEGWKALLSDWMSGMDEFIRICRETRSGEDLPFWYNEYSNAGFLATTVWKLGGVAIQEYGVDRLSAECARESKGRCDLWFCLPKYGMEYVIEAKFTYAPTLDYATKAFDRLVKQAHDQIRTCRPSSRKICQHMAVVFICPYNQSAAESRDILLGLYECFQQLEDSRRVLAFYQAPPGSKTDHVDERDGVRYYYPGVILIGQLLEQATG